MIEIILLVLGIAFVFSGGFVTGMLWTAINREKEHERAIDEARQ